MGIKTLDLTMQITNSENGSAVLTSMLAYYKKYVPLDEVRTECSVSRMNTTIEQFCTAAEHYGLKTEVFEGLTVEDLKKMEFPLVVQWNKRNYVIIRGYKNNRFYLGDTSKGNTVKGVEEFERRFTGRAITLKKGDDFQPGGDRVRHWQTIFRRAKDYKKSCIIILALNIMTTLAATVSIAVNRRFIDAVLSGTKPDMELTLCIAMVTLMLVRVGMSVAETFQTLGMSERVSARHGSELYKKLLHVQSSFYESHYIGDVLDRLDTCKTLDQSILKSAIPRFLDATMTLVYAVLLFCYRPDFAALFVAIEIVNVLIAGKIRVEIGIVSGSLNTSQAALNSIVLSLLNTIETIKSIGVEGQFYSTWSRTNRDYVDNQYRRSKLNIANTLASGITTTVSISLLLFLSAVFIIKGEFTIGIMSSFQAVLTHMRSSLNKALETAGNLRSLEISVNRLDDIMTRPEDEQIKLEGEADKLKGDISIQNACYRYNKYDDCAVKNFSLDIKEGEFIALVGSTGCGKSTLLKLLSGLYQPETGTILYDGQPRNRIPDVVFHSSLATVDQEPVPFHDTVEMNLKLYDECIENYEMILAARDAQIHDRIIASPDGYQTIVAENGRNFSGGEIQRIELARALSMEPTILILDEFTSALDAITEDEVFQSLKQRGNVTCIIAAHRYSTVMSCDKVIVMKNGEIAEMGEPYALLATDGEFSRLVNKN